MGDIEHWTPDEAERLAQLSGDPVADLAAFMVRTSKAEGEVESLRRQHRGAVEALRVLALAAEGVLNDAEGQPRKVLREALRAAHTRFGGQ